MSFEEYLLWEDAQGERHEYANGQVVAMAGASDPHEFVALNLAALLLGHLRGKGYRVYKGDMKLRYRAGETDLSYYPSRRKARRSAISSTEMAASRPSGISDRPVPCRLSISSRRTTRELASSSLKVRLEAVSPAIMP
jgi:hypothetical protein